MAKQRNTRSTILLITAPLFFSGCFFSSPELELKKSKNQIERNDFDKAQKTIDRLISRDIDSDMMLSALRLGARLAHYDRKDYKKAIEYYKKIQMLSPVVDERVDSQHKIADIYFENLNSHKEAIEEYNQLLAQPLTVAQRKQIKLRIAKAYFSLNDFFQAESEATRALQISAVDQNQENIDFEIQLFLASIFFNTKRVDEALKIYQKLEDIDPDRAENENMRMNIILCLEELERFDEAIQKLKALKKSSGDQEFIDFRIKRLEHRKANLPGSRGLKK